MQAFVVEPDSHITTSAESIREQHEFLDEIRGGIARTNRTIDAVCELRDQIRHWEHRGEASNQQAVADAARGLCQQLDAMLPKLIDVTIGQAQLWPSGLHEKLNALFDSVDSADQPPPKQARDVFAQLSTELDDLVDEYEHLVGEAVVSLNNAIARAGLPYVGAAGTV